MNWKDYITEAEQVLGETSEGVLEEKMVKKYYIEHGQKKVKWVTDKPGYRIEYDQNHMPREVKIRTTEKINRRKGAKIGSLKHNKKREQALRKKSFLSRERLGLDYDKETPELNTRREEGQTLKSDVKGALKQKLQNLKDKLMKDVVKV